MKRREFLTTTRIIILGFFCGILVGTALLCLPCSWAEGVQTKPIDALFTATTSICVTGLVTVNTFENWSLFGQVVILFLIQFGGLGIITFTTTVLLVLRRRITLKERMLIQESYNLDTLGGLVKLTKHVLKGTFLVEGIGALCYALVFIPEFGFWKGLWNSLFHSVSAFCNAGIDLLGPDSLAPYRDHAWMNLTTCALIILGGIGFPVWWDVLRVIRLKKEEKFTFRKMCQKLHLHSKLALMLTILLVAGGTFFTLVLEYQNPQTLGLLSFPEKLQAAFFQSVTLRTAGFFTIPQQNFMDDSTFLFLLLMFVGGSPSGTAGGVKTVTIAVLLLAVLSSVKGKEDVEVYRRTIPDSYVKKALAVVGIGLMSMGVFVVLFCLIQPGDFLNLLFELVSALGTVGLTRGITSTLLPAGKVLIILAMFFGRVGPITMALAFNRQNARTLRKYPEEKIRVG